jgi:hypothetical protein
MTDETFDTIDFRSVALLSRRVGQRYGFAAVSLASRTDVALMGGAVHFELSSTQTASAKGDIERGNPIPFSQVHCIDSEFNCSLLSISSVKDLPCPRLYHTATRLGETDVVVFGGQAFIDKRKLSDIWILHMDDSMAGEWRELAPASRSTAFPPPRSKHAVTSVGNNGLIVSGGSGFEDSLLGDLWLAQIDKTNGVVWKKLTATTKVPSARKLHALSPMISEMEFLLHGGVDGNGNQLSDLWIGRIGNDKCTWIELVASSHPRSGSHLIVPDSRSGNHQILIFGGNHPSASKYNLNDGNWSVCPFPEGVGHSFVSAPIDVSYDLEDLEDPMKTHKVVVPSVLMVPDTVLRSNPSSPVIASIFPINPHASEEQIKEDEKPAIVNPVDLQANVSQRRMEYRELCNQLPSIPPPVADEGGAIMARPSEDRMMMSVVQSPLFVVDYLVTGIMASEGQVSLSSWSSHILGTAEISAIDSLDALKLFVNSESTLKFISECSNSCVLHVTTSSGEKLIAFISEALNRHSLCSRFVSPAVSILKSNYAQVQATLRLIMTYTPFKSPAALEELFALFSNSGSGFLLIDFDGEVSENKAPLLSHFKPTVVKDSALFWGDILGSIPRCASARIDQYALTFLETSDVAVNGSMPSLSLKETIEKSKLFDKPINVSLGRFGTMTVGRLAKSTGPQAGILVYSEGVLVRHIQGRFPFEARHETEDELDNSVYSVTGIAEVGTVFTPVHGALSDFQEAMSKSADWTQFVNKVQEACASYLSSS